MSEHNPPTEEELQRRRVFYDRMEELRASEPGSADPFPTVEETLREDRDR
jgi:hypothetical protein